MLRSYVLINNLILIQKEVIFGSEVSQLWLKA